MSFSIIVPLYNKASYVRKALESVFAQTYDDWELIVVNDGSTDESKTIAQRCIDEYESSENGSRSVMLLSQDNSGVGAARNNGVKASSGEFVCFLDADDWWAPTFLEEMAAFIPQYPAAGLYACNYVYYKPGKTHVAVRHETGYMNYPKAYRVDAAMPVCSDSVVIPRGVFDSFGGFSETLKLGEDFFLWSRIAVSRPIAFLDKPLAYYNFDIPVKFRAIGNLYKPQYNMLFNLDDFSEQVAVSEIPDADKQSWKMLLDRLRINGLLDYWMDPKYHDAAAAELAKVDWTAFSASARKAYQKPIPILKAKRQFLHYASVVKQAIIKSLLKK